MKNKKIWLHPVILIIGILIGWLVWGNFGNNLNKDEIKNIIDKNFVQGQGELKIGAIKSAGNISEVEVEINNQKLPIFVNDNGKVYYQKILDLDEKKEEEKVAAKANEVKNKSDKPKVELFVMSYCPYGTQTEKGYLPAVNKLGDKIDAKIKFVNYAMHPTQGEVQENLLQYCIQKEQPKKFNSYLACFLDKGDTNGCLKKNNISKDSLKTCLDTTDKKFAITKNLKDKKSWLNGRFPRFNINDELNKKYGVQGSPTLVVNGQTLNTGRDANSIFKVICSAFKTQPEVCKENLDTTTPAPGFGYDKTGEVNNLDGGCGA